MYSFKQNSGKMLWKTELLDSPGLFAVFRAFSSISLELTTYIF